LGFSSSAVEVRTEERRKVEVKKKGETEKREGGYGEKIVGWFACVS